MNQSSHARFPSITQCFIAERRDASGIIRRISYGYACALTYCSRPLRLQSSHPVLKLLVETMCEPILNYWGVWITTTTDTKDDCDDCPHRVIFGVVTVPNNGNLLVDYLMNYKIRRERKEVGPASDGLPSVRGSCSMNALLKHAKVKHTIQLAMVHAPWQLQMLAQYILCYIA